MSQPVGQPAATGSLYQQLNEACRHLVQTTTLLIDKVEKGCEARVLLAGSTHFISSRIACNSVEVGCQKFFFGQDHFLEVTSF